MPIVYVLEGCWFCFLLYAVKVVEQGNGVKLPTGFRSVLYLDVFGWIQKNVTGSAPHNKLSECLQDHGVLKQPDSAYGTGPAVQSVRYDKHGRPVPMRVEQLPGAARQQRMADLTKADFSPTTFVPCGKDDDAGLAALNEELEPDDGGRPWKVFRAVGTLLATMWFLSGIWVGCELWGVTNFELNPLLVEPGHHLDARRSKKLGTLQFGEAVKTSWPNARV